MWPKKIERGLACVFIFAITIALSCYRPILYGVRVQEVAGFWIFIILYVVAPGVLVYSLLGSDQGDWLIKLGMGATIGHALQILGFVGLKMLRVPGLFSLYPLIIIPLAIPAFLRAKRNTPQNIEALPPWIHLVTLLVISAISIQIQPIFSDNLSQESIPLDQLFHAGNAAELLHHWPLSDPRVADTAFNYHFFAYSFPSGASQITGIPVSTLMLRLVPMVSIVLLVVQLYNAGRLVTGNRWAGLITSGVFMFHTDIGTLFRPGQALFNSYLWAGIYSSITTSFGFIYLSSLTIALHRWLNPDRRPGLNQAILLGLLGWAASGTKGSVMPVVLLGVITAIVGCTFWARVSVKRLFFAGVILGISAAPMTLMLVLGESAYTQVFRLSWGSAVYNSAFSQALQGFLPSLGMGRAILITLVWLLGYLGVAGVGSLVYLIGRKTRMSSHTVWMGGVFLSGLPLAYFLATPWGLSQLFFLYNGQVMLSIFCGAAVVSMPRYLSWRQGVIWALLLLFAIPILSNIVREVRNGTKRDLKMAGTVADPAVMAHLDGMIWLKENTPVDSIILTNHGSFLVSVYGERRTFYETGVYTSKSQAQRWHGVMEPFPELLALRRIFFERPAAVYEGFLRKHPSIYVVVDNIRTIGFWNPVTFVQPIKKKIPGFPGDFAFLLYANSFIEVYQIKAPGS